MLQVVFEIEHDTALIAVDTGEIAAVVMDLIIGAEGAELPGHVAGGRFDFNDVGAVIGEHLGTERSREHAGEIDDFNAVEGPGGAHRSPQ